MALNNSIPNTSANSQEKYSKGVPELFYWNKKEAISLLQKRGLQLPNVLPQDDFANSIRKKTSNVKVKKDFMIFIQ